MLFFKFGCHIIAHFIINCCHLYGEQCYSYNTIMRTVHRVSTVVFCNCTECLPGVSGVFRAGGGGAMVRSLHLWSDCEFLDNFWTVFISFVS